MKRINFAITSKIEGKILNLLVAKVPKWITPDLLTAAALISSLIGGVGYILAYSQPIFLHLINICIFFHWLTDSLDGKLAIFRKKPRPNYGFYIDHMLDSVSAVFILGGISTSTLTATAAWVWVLALMLLSMTHVFLKTTIFKTFQMSLGFIGPTEARLALIFMNLFVFFFGNPGYIVFNTPINLVDIIGWFAVLAMLFTLVPEVIQTAIKLHQKDTTQAF